MSTITINNPTVAVVPPTPITNSPLVATGNGEVSAQTPNYINDGNAPATLSWSVTNVLNGTFVSTGVDIGSVTYKGANGTQVVPSGGSVKLNFFFNVPAGAAGVVNAPCTADYTVQWQ